MASYLKSVFTYFLFALLVLNFESASAQKGGFHQGYIVTLDNDTIKGFVKNLNSFPYRILTNIKFKSSNKAKVWTYEPSQLKSYKIINDLYESRRLNSIPIFVRLVASGNVNLYEITTSGMYNNPTGGSYMRKSTSHYLKRKDEDNLFKIAGPHFKERLCNYFNDAPSICQKIMNGEYRKKNVSQIVAEYNSVDSTDRTNTLGISHVYSKGFSFGVKGGANLSRLVYRHQPVGLIGLVDNYEFGTHFGVFFHNRLSDKFSLIPEIQYISKRSNLNGVEIPLIISYSIEDRFNIEAGPNFQLLFRSTAKKINAIEDINNVPADYGLNVGLRIKFSDRLSLSCRYYHGLRDIFAWYDNGGLRLSTSGYDRNIQISTYFNITKSR